MTAFRTRTADGDDAVPDDDASGSAAAGKKRRRKQRSFWTELPFLIVFAFVLALLVRAFLVQAFYIPSVSMENTLLINNKVVVNKLSYKLHDVHRGDIVVFNVIGLWKTQAEYEQELDTSAPKNPVGRAIAKVGGIFGFSELDRDYYIKRVIGVGGDKVACCDDSGRVTVNGVALDEESYLFPGAKPSQVPFSVTVPDGDVWVMGDNRQDSSDSRAHRGSPGGGAVPESAIAGRAFALIYPFDRATLFSPPDTFEQPRLTSGPAPAPDPRGHEIVAAAAAVVALRRTGAALSADGRPSRS